MDDRLLTGHVQCLICWLDPANRLVILGFRMLRWLCENILLHNRTSLTWCCCCCFILCLQSTFCENVQVFETVVILHQSNLRWLTIFKISHYRFIAWPLLHFIKSSKLLPKLSSESESTEMLRCCYCCLSSFVVFHMLCFSGTKGDRRGRLQWRGHLFSNDWA